MLLLHQVSQVQILNLPDKVLAYLVRIEPDPGLLLKLLTPGVQPQVRISNRQILVIRMRFTDMLETSVFEIE